MALLAATSTTPTYEHVFPTLPKSFVHSKIFRIVMQILASSSTADDEHSTLTFNVNHTTTSFPHVKPQTSMSAAINETNATTLSNITFEQMQQRIDHPKLICIVAVGSVFAFLTTAGNLMVLVSFKIDKQLQTITNYFLFSLAVADIAIGIISIPIMTYYMAADTVWGLGYAMCQFWLCLDYMMSNASVLNLLLISFDRYFSVTKPLSYRPRRTAKKAFLMIASTYIASAMLWPPWIISWPYIEGQFTDPHRCVVQFIETNQLVSVGTTIAAFWLPLIIMIVLYSRVYYETKKQQKDMCLLQAGQNQYNTSKSRAKSTVLSNLRNNLFSGRAANSSSNYPLKMMGKQFCCLRICCESGSDKSGGDVQQVVADEASTASSNYARYYCAQNRLRQSPPVSLNSQENNSLLPERISASGSQINRRDQSSTNSVSIKLKDNEYGESRVRLSSFNSNISQPSTRLPASKEEAQRNVVLQQALNGTAVVNKLFNEQQKSERDNRKSERKQESKAAKTLSAILLAFIITWTPYNVIVCWEAFYKNSVPAVYFHIAYFLCYINSTINPFCYAFCNPRFRLTYKRILTGNWKRQQPSGLNKMAYLNRT